MRNKYTKKRRGGGRRDFIDPVRHFSNLSGDRLIDPVESSRYSHRRRSINELESIRNLIKMQQVKSINHNLRQIMSQLLFFFENPDEYREVVLLKLKHIENAIKLYNI